MVCDSQYFFFFDIFNALYVQRDVTLIIIRIYNIYKITSIIIRSLVKKFDSRKFSVRIKYCRLRDITRLERLTIFALALLDQSFVFYILVACFAIEPRPGKIHV